MTKPERQRRLPRSLWLVVGIALMAVAAGWWWSQRSLPLAGSPPGCPIVHGDALVDAIVEGYKVGTSWEKEESGDLPRVGLLLEGGRPLGWERPANIPPQRLVCVPSGSIYMPRSQAEHKTQPLLITQWHFPEFWPNGDDKPEMTFRYNPRDIADQGEAFASRKLNVYLSDHVERRKKEGRPVAGREWPEAGLIEYDFGKKSSQGVRYQVKNRQPHDISVITCGNTAPICVMRGGTWKQGISIDSMQIWRENLIHWRAYQQMYQKRLDSMLVDDHYSWIEED